MKPQQPIKQPRQNIFRSRKNVLIAVALLLVALGIILSSGGKSSRESNFDRQNSITDAVYEDLATQEDLQILGDQGLQREFIPSNEPTIAANLDSFDTKIVPLPAKQPTIPEIAQATSNVPVESQEKKIIKNGNLSLSVTNIDQASDNITQIARTNGGDTMNKNITGNTQKKRYGQLVVRVPSVNFEQTITALKEIASVIHHESVTTNDVTEQFVDTQVRLSTKKAHENRLLSFFEKAEDVEDLIRIEKELSRVRNDIEIIEGRLTRLENQTSFSSIIVDLEEDALFGAKNQWRPAQVVKDSANELVTRSQKLIDSMIIISISSLPLIIISLIGLAIAYALIKKLLISYLNYTDKKKN